jgi:glutamate dehydrogenase/leucine dehydrogenase
MREVISLPYSPFWLDKRLRMTVMDINQLTQYEGLYICNDIRNTGLFAIVAVHDTSLGPAIGGCRCVPYSTVEAAVQDAMLLGKAMSRKSAISGLSSGGGKAVLMKPPVIQDREAYFGRFGEFVESLGGVYYTAVDSGTTQEDLDIIAKHTQYVSAQVDKNAPPEATASWLTAQTVLSAMKAAAEVGLGSADMSQYTIAVQGVGKVGGFIVDGLIAQGATVIVSETHPENLDLIRRKYPQVHVVAPQEIIHQPCDIFAPCALGGVLTLASLEKLQARVVCGAANNPLESPRVAQALLSRGVTYVPDFVANAGGVILASMKLQGKSQVEWEQKARAMSDTTIEILTRSRDEGLSSDQIACQIADERLARAKIQLPLKPNTKASPKIKSRATLQMMD